MIKGDTQVRISIPFANPGGVERGEPVGLTVTANQDPSTVTSATIPAKEWSIIDDALAVSDCISFSVANDEGENAGRFQPAQLIQVWEAHPKVAGGAWVKHFTGRVTTVESYTDVGGGSNILVTAMDLGWHLQNCHAPAHNQIKNARFAQRSPSKQERNKRTLLEILIDPTWGIDLTKVSFDGNKMSRLKHGRIIQEQELTKVEGQILPFIQVEPGQTPFEILRLYAEREGLLINVDRDGQLVFFRPDYKKKPIYQIDFHAVRDPRHNVNNVIGRPTLRQTIDGLYSEVTCWSTVVHDDQLNTDNPNAAYTHTNFNPEAEGAPHLLPFHRHHVIQDSEAINETLRRNRAIMRYQMGQFESWEYIVEVPGHTQGPDNNHGFYVSNELVSVSDTINALEGDYYVQRVQRSSTIGGGNKTQLTIRKSGLLNPLLGSLVTPAQKRKVGGGARGKSSAPQESQVFESEPIFDAQGNEIGQRAKVKT